MNNVLITNLNRANIQRIKNTLNAKFHIIDLRLYVYYLDIIVIRDRANRTIRLE